MSMMPDTARYPVDGTAAHWVATATVEAHGRLPAVIIHQGHLASVAISGCIAAAYRTAGEMLSTSASVTIVWADGTVTGLCHE